MPDTTINLLVKVSGQTELNSLIDKIKGGTASQYDLERAAKLYMHTAKGLQGTLDAAVRPAIEKATVAMKEMAQAGMAPLTTAIGKQRESYFRLGEGLRAAAVGRGGLTDLIRKERQEDRMLNFGIRETLGAVQGLTGQNKLLTQSVMGAVESFSGMGFALNAMGFSMLSLPIALLVGGITLITSLLKEQKEEVSGLADLYDQLFLAQKKLKGEDSRAFYEGQITRLQQEKKRLTESAYDKGGISGFNFDPFSQKFGVTRDKAIFNAEKYKEVEEAILKIDIQILAAQQKISDETKQTTEEAKKLADAAWGGQGRYMDWQASIAGAGVGARESGKALAASMRAKNEARRAGKGTVADKKETEPEVALQYLQKYNKEMTLGEQAIVGVADGVAGLQSAWTGAISGLLTGTQSLGQAFVQMGHAIIAELSAIIAKMIAMSILGNIIRVGAGIATGGASFGGEMATGGLFTSSGSTGSVINKMSESQMGRLPRTGGGSMFSTPPSVTVVPIVNNQGLAVRVEVAGRINTLRRY
jgi:hypothetical protein